MKPVCHDVRKSDLAPTPFTLIKHSSSLKQIHLGSGFSQHTRWMSFDTPDNNWVSEDTDFRQWQQSIWKSICRSYLSLSNYLSGCFNVVIFAIWCARFPQINTHLDCNQIPPQKRKRTLFIILFTFSDIQYLSLTCRLGMGSCII